MLLVLGNDLRADDAVADSLIKNPPILNGQNDLRKIKKYRKAFSKEVGLEYAIHHPFAKESHRAIEKAFFLALEKGSKEDIRFYQGFYLISIRLVEPIQFIKEARLYLNDDYNLKSPYVVWVCRDLTLLYMGTEQHEYALEFLPLYDELYNLHGKNIQREQDFSRHNRALLYYRIGNYKEALKTYKERLRVMRDELSVGGLSGVYHDIGLCYTGLHKKDSALFYYNKGLAVIEEYQRANPKSNNMYYLTALLNMSIQQPYLRTTEYQKAIPALHELLHSAKIANDVSQQQSALYKLAEVNYSNSYLSASQTYLNQLFVLHERYFKKGNYRMALSLSAKLNLALGNKQLADSLYERLYTFNDSLKRVQSTYIVANAQVKTLLRSKEREVLAEQKENGRKQRLLWFGLIGILAFGMITFISSRASARNKKSKKQIELQNELLNQSVDEKEMLMREIHHRVKNNLQVMSSLLLIQAESSSNPEVKETLSLSQKRLFSIATIHELLYSNENIQSVAAQEYFEEITAQNLEIQGEKVNYTIETDHISLIMDKAIPLGLMLNELITNSFKYAFEGKGDKQISITLKEHMVQGENNYIFVYQDNGIGIQGQTSSKNTLGLSIVDMMAQQLKGTLERNGDAGLRYELIFP